MADEILRFVEHARGVLSNALGANRRDQRDVPVEPGWAWIMSRVLACCRSYPGGVTEAILLSELFQGWSEKERLGKKRGSAPSPYLQLKQKRQPCTPSVATIDSIVEKNFVSLDAALEAVVLDIQLLPGTTSYILTLGDVWSGNTIEHYLHCKYYDMVQGDGAVIRRGRELRLTGCRLRTARAGGGPLRLLPTEYLVTLLNEDQDDDACFLGAQFCADTFRMVQSSTVEAATDYYLYGRVENVVELETQGKKGHVKQRQLVLVDTHGDSMPFILWDEQIVLASVLSLGSMVALEKPYVARDLQCDARTASGLCLQFGSATRVFSVPYVQHEEQVVFGSTQHKFRPTQELRDGKNDLELLLPCDSKGSVDLSKYPFRISIEELTPKMSNIALYGEVAFAKPGTAGKSFLLGIKDDTGLVEIELEFAGTWNAGELFVGQTVFLSGITSHKNELGRLTCSWVESGHCTSLVNVSRLSAIITSPCLHCTVPIRLWSTCAQICRVKLRKVPLEHLQVQRVHSSCGQEVTGESGSEWFCQFCQSPCADEISRQIKCIIHFSDVLDPSGEQAISSLVGQAALSLLQVSAEIFCTWLEDEKALYLLSLESEEFLVSFFDPGSKLAVGCAMKC